MAQGVKDSVLSLQRSRFDPWPRNFHVLWVQPKKKKKINKGGVPFVVQQLMNLIRIHEDVGSIPGLTQ